jgi:hypothetical protein
MYDDDFVSRLLLAIHGIAENDLRTPEGEGRWSILDVIAHLGDFEQLTGTRLRLILAHDTPQLPAIDQEPLVATHRGEPQAELLEHLGFYRRSNLALVARLGDAGRTREGVHPQYGALTVTQLMERAQIHQEKHLGQVERIKRVHGLTASDAPQNAHAAAHASTANVRAIGDVRVRDLWQSGVRRALQVDFPAGSQWPGLDHHVPGPEEVYVVTGDFDDGGKVYGPGSFLHYPAGSSHSPRTTEGCTLFVFYPEG